jgi:hypothetical protein
MNEFFAGIYEKFFYSSPFSDDVYQEGIYGPLGIIAFVGALVMMAIFYYIINRPSFSRWYHWLIILGIHFAMQYGICILQTKPKFSELKLEYGSEYWTFAFMHAFFATLLFIGFSFLFRWWSKNCKRTPIPN